MPKPRRSLDCGAGSVEASGGANPIGVARVRYTEDRRSLVAQHPATIG